MCDKVNTLKQTKNGLLLVCPECRIFYLSFGQIYMELSDIEFKSFNKFLHELDATYWEKRYCNCTLKRRIPIPTVQQNLFIMINRIELEELKQLTQLTMKNENILLKAKHIDYIHLAN